MSESVADRLRTVLEKYFSDYAGYKGLQQLRQDLANLPETQILLRDGLAAILADPHFDCEKFVHGFSYKRQTEAQARAWLVDLHEELFGHTAPNQDELDAIADHQDPCDLYENYLRGGQLSARFRRAVAWFLELAETSDKAAFTLFGATGEFWLHDESPVNWTRVITDIASSKHWGSAAERVYHWIGDEHENPNYGTKVDLVQAFRWYQKSILAAAKDGMKEFQALQPLFRLLSERGLAAMIPASEATEWLARHAHLGGTLWFSALADLYESGAPGIPMDYSIAADWYRRSAEQGSVGSCTNLGRLYATGGHGLPQNPRLALAFFKKAAKAGSTSAMMTLARLYSSGTGARQSHRQARKWFAKAAEHHDLDAMCELAKIHEMGLGVRPNPALAEAWYRKSANLEGTLGNPDARTWLKAHIAK